MIYEISLPINSEIKELGVNNIKLGISDLTKKSYCIVEGVPDVKVFTYFKNYHEIVVGTFRVLNKRASCPLHTVLRVTAFVEDNYLLFSNTMKQLRGMINGV